MLHLDIMLLFSLFDIPDSYYIIAFVVVFCAIAIGSYFFNSKRAILKTLKKHRAKPINTIKDGEYVKIVGKAMPLEESLIAPLSKRRCVFYNVIVEQEVDTGETTKWKNILTDNEIKDFLLDVNGEKVIIQPKPFLKNKQFVLDEDKKYNAGIFKNSDDTFAAYLRKNNINAKNFIGIKKEMRCKEGVVELGEKVVLLGIAEWKTSEKPIPGHEFSKILSITDSQSQPLIITDILDKAL